MRNVDQLMQKVSDLRDLCHQVARLNPERRLETGARREYRPANETAPALHEDGVVHPAGNKVGKF